jgi:hypothetical protein
MSEAKANSSDKALRNLEDLLPDLLQAASRRWSLRPAPGYGRAGLMVHRSSFFLS